MIKKVFVLFICAMMMVSGCGSGDSADKQSEVNYTQEAAKDTADSPVVQDDFHGITFQISDRWVKDTQTDEDAI
jgi:hypothetical protein